MKHRKATFAALFSFSLRGSAFQQHRSIVVSPHHAFVVVTSPLRSSTVVKANLDELELAIVKVEIRMTERIQELKYDGQANLDRLETRMTESVKELKNDGKANMDKLETKIDKLDNTFAANVQGLNYVAKMELLELRIRNLEHRTNNLELCLQKILDYLLIDRPPKSAEESVGPCPKTGST